MGPGGFFPTNPDLADILGRADLDFENFHFFDFLDSKFLDFQVPRFPEIWPGPGLGRAWARPWAGLGLGDPSAAALPGPGPFGQAGPLG